MPGVIELISVFAAAYIGGGVAISTAVFYGVSAALTIGLGLGLSALTNALLGGGQRQPKPEDVQSSVRQPSQPRARHYGRVKVSGPWVFGESKAGTFYKVLAIGQGPIDAIEEYWIDDEAVTLDGSGNVTSGAKTGYAQLKTRFGASTEAAYSELISAFPEWTTAHRGDGVASLLAIQKPIESENYFKTFPSGINTSYRLVLRGAQVYNPVAETTGWNDNAAAVILDYMQHADGMRLPSGIFTTPEALATWQTAYTRSGAAFTLAAGGTEPQYRIWGSYFLDERPADVLSRMLQVCDGRLYPTSDGGLGLDIGEWYEPTVTLDENAIVAFSDLARGRDVLNTANVVRATYLGTDQDYQTADADQWIDDEDVSSRGEIAVDIQLLMCPSHSQARRLMKKMAYRANPSWVGTFQCNLRGLAAVGERFVRITYPLFEIDEVFEVQDFQFIIGDGGILQGCTLQVISLPEAAYEWDSEMEEGSAPVREDTIVDRTIPDPTGFDVTIRRKTVGGALVPYAVLEFDDPPPGLVVEAQGKATADSSWIPIGVQDEALEAESFALSDGEEYEFQVRHVTASFRRGDWTNSIEITPVADETAPGVVTGVSATGGVGEVLLEWTNPNSANFHAVNIYRNTADDFGTATLVHTEFGAANGADSFTDTVAADDYYYWLRARNASGVEAAAVATGIVTAT